MNSFSKYLFEHLHFGLEEKDFTLIEKIIFFLIILNCVFVVIESEKLIYEQYNQLFDSAKLFFGIVFLIEYICRLIAVDQIDKFKLEHNKDVDIIKEILKNNRDAFSLRMDTL